MANSISLTNYNRPNLVGQPTALTQDLAAGVNSLPVGNSASFSGGGYVIIGSLGSSVSEMQTATSPVSSTAIPLSATTSLPHNFNDLVTLLFGNQIRVYRANDVSGNGTQPPDADFSLITTINITPNSASTQYTDATGVAGQWYKFTYYNSTTTSETDLSSSNAAQTGVVHIASTDQVRNAAGFRTNAKVTDDIINEFRDAAEKEVLGSLAAVYTLPLPQPTNPIVVEIVKNIAAGELMHEEYLEVSPSMAAEGEAKASTARNGGGSHTSLAELVDREVILMDANYNEETIDEAHGFGGWPDETTQDTSGTLSNRELGSTGQDHGFQFWINKEY
ncbi:MAG TPA: hypothetical protein VNG51_19450 [Ktedonobacteraceae bacterium]|nr:hypothetical protein [Ktedonobacteraceae bacterium]